MWLLLLEGCQVKPSPEKEVPTSPLAGSGLRLSFEAQRLADRHCTGLVFRNAYDAKSFFRPAHTAEKLLLDTPEAHSAGS